MFCWHLLESYKSKEKHIEFCASSSVEIHLLHEFEEKILEYWCSILFHGLTTFPLLIYCYSMPSQPLLKHLSVWESVQETELFIDHCRDLDLLSTIAIIFRFMVQTICCWFKRFSFKNDICCRWRYRHHNLAGNTAWIDDVKKPITLVHSKVVWFCQ